jgi:CBS domain-containing protein
MQTMTVHRTRHIPVRSGDDAEGERLVGVVSLGDLVRHRLDEKSQEIEILHELNLAVRP